MSNLSQQKRQEILDYIAQLKDIHNDDESIIALNNIENALTEKKYGLVWEEHSEKVDEMLEHHIPVFEEVEERKIEANSEGGFNFLLEGDNLHSLKLLEKTHQDKIDIIYIDPPYNRDGEFIYNDTRIEKDDSYGHSKWLSFMHERLEIARGLLKDSGIIFISIDDVEQAQLKILCDDIFGEANFIAQSIIASNSSKNNSNFISVNHEYLLCYAKRIEKTKKSWLVKKNQIDEFENRAKRLIKMGLSNEEIHKELLYLVKYPRFYDFDHYTYADERGVYRTDNPGGVKNGNFETDLIHPVTGNVCKKPSGGWRYNEQTLNEMVENGDIHFGKDETIIPNPKRYLHDYPMQVPKSTLYFDSQASTKWLKRQGFEFDFPKSLDYIVHLLSYTQDDDVTVLDFFAGSGTTGHAVMQLNKEDGGNRKYILCTNNENNICEEITYQRLKNIQEELPHNLKYYKTDFINKLNEDEVILSSKLLDHIKEMVELENMCEIDGVNQVLVLTEDDLDKWLTSDIQEGAILFLPSYILLSRDEEELCREKNVMLIDIPDYYFLNELREAREL